MTRDRRWGLGVVAALVAATALVVTRTPRPRRDEAPPPLVASPPGQLPRDPLGYVPASARVLIAADLDALRRAPATRRLFAETPSEQGDCRAALARRMRTVALVIPALPVEDFAFVAAGDVTPDDLARCVPEAEAIERDGVTLRVVDSSRGDGGDAGGRLVWTPAGVVLVGSRALVARMLDRGFDAFHGEVAPSSLDALRRRVRARATLWAVALHDDATPPDDPLASVRGGALSADVTDALALDGVLLCDDRGHARRVVEALERARAQAAASVEVAALRALIEGARAEADGPVVRVRAALDAASLAGVIDSAAATARDLGSSLPTGRPGR